MKGYHFFYGCCIVIFAACTEKTGKTNTIFNPAPDTLATRLKGTWRLRLAETVTDGKHAVQDYSQGQQMIKIINETHFAFLKHDLDPDRAGKNNFDAGGGTYRLVGDQYIESLDFYADRNWEGKSFTFKIQIKGDTLIQTGIEKVEEAGVDRTITETYVRENKQ